MPQRRDASNARSVLVVGQVLDVLVPVDAAFVSGFCFVGYAVEGIPDDVEIFAAA